MAPYRWAIFLTVCMGLGVLSSATDRFQAFTSESARRFLVLENPVELPTTELIDMFGNQQELAAYAGKPTIIDFIYTDCPWVCYAMGSTLEQVKEHLIDDGYSDQFRILSISFDPEHDGPTELKDYADRFNATGAVWTTATVANKADLSRLLKAFGIIVIEAENGELEHNAAIHILDKNGKLSAILDFEDIAGVVAEVSTEL